MAPLPLLRTWSGLLGLPDPSSSPAAANEDRLSPPTFTIYLYYATFTTLLPHYSTLTTYSYYSIATAVAYEVRLLPPLLLSTYTTPPSLLYYFTTSLLLLTPTTFRSFPRLLRGWTVGGVLVMPVMDASGVARRGFGLWASWASSLLPVGSTPGVAPSELEWMD